MLATTIKLENPILHELKTFVPKDTSLSAFVRDILEQEIKRRKMTRAAEQYSAFLRTHQEEETWLGDWENATLTQAPKPTRKRKTA